MDIDRNMPAEQNLTGFGSDTGAGTAQSLSIPQVSPVFSYSLKEGGDVYVYVFDTGVAKVAVITLDDTASEVAYACHTILSSNVAHALVWDAVENFQENEEDEPNPFRELAENKEVMKRLNDLLASIFYGE